MTTPRRRLLLVLSLPLALPLAAPFAGCASDAERAESAAADSVSAFRKNLDAMPSNIDKTMAALTEVASPSNTNKAESYRKFSSEFSWMQNRANEMGAQADRAVANSKNYFREWAREGMASRNNDERKRIEQAIADSRVDTDKALQYLTDGRRNYGEFANRLRDIQNRLRGDMSQPSIDALGPSIERARRDAMDVKNTIARLGEQIDATLSAR